MMLTDTYFRKHTYLRVSITDKCNLRCAYCMPPGGVVNLEHDEVLRNEEFTRLIKIFSIMGVDKIRFTGGEPLIRKGFINIVSDTRKISPHIDLALTTNGILLGNFLKDLSSLGMHKLNISLDTLSRGRYENITGSDSMNTVISNIENALSYKSFDIKINAVLLESTLDEIENFLEFIKDKPVKLRFIEKMPFEGISDNFKFVPSHVLVDRLKTFGKLERNQQIDTNVAMMYDLNYRDKYKIHIGIIPPVTHKFCQSCNRLRLTSDGFLKSCLYSNDEFDLKSSLRKDLGDDDIKKIIAQAVISKSKGHSIEYSTDSGGCYSISTKRAMSKIGG
jgi:cyclic pyranopterin phosphate synthase